MASQANPASAADTTQQKRIHSLIVDTGPLIKNEPALSTLIAQAEQLYTIPSVLSEIKASPYPAYSQDPVSASLR